MLEFILENLNVLLIGIGALISIAWAVTKLTPGQEDDKVVETIRTLWASISAFLSRFARTSEPVAPKPEPMVEERPADEPLIRERTDAKDEPEGPTRAR